MRFFKPLFATSLLSALSLSLQAGIISVSVPKESQDFNNNDGYAARDDIWTATAPPFPLNTDLGIGHLLNTSPAILAADIDPLTRLGVLHSHKYDAPYVPVSSAVVSFTFDAPTVVDQLELIQHFDGITRVEGFVGNELNSLLSIGNIFGPDGEVHGSAHFTAGQSYLFDFNNSIAGTIFQFRITQTSLVDGYALHRAFPRLADGTYIAAVPEPTIPALVGVLSAILLFRPRVKAPSASSP
jgi:hypothetical protein